MAAGCGGGGGGLRWRRVEVAVAVSVPSGGCCADSCGQPSAGAAERGSSRAAGEEWARAGGKRCRPRARRTGRTDGRTTAPMASTWESVCARTPYRARPERERRTREEDESCRGGGESGAEPRSRHRARVHTHTHTHTCTEGGESRSRTRVPVCPTATLCLALPYSNEARGAGVPRYCSPSRVALWGHLRCAGVDAFLCAGGRGCTAALADSK